MTCKINQRLVDALKEFMTDYEEVVQVLDSCLMPESLKRPSTDSAIVWYQQKQHEISIPYVDYPL